MDRFPVVSRRAVSSVVIALGLMLTVVGTAPSEASNRGTGAVKWFGPDKSTTTTVLVVGQATEPAQPTQTLAPASEPTQPIALLLPAIQTADDADEEPRKN